VRRRDSIETTSLAALLNHIHCVIFLCSEEQMVGIHAGWYVTAMKNKQAKWKRTSVKFPSEAVRFL
jgi:hypothetical protein